MRVLITGGLGFLGHAVLSRLIDLGHSPVAVTSRAGRRARVPGAQIAHADIRDRDRLAAIVRDLRPEAVCHLAALTKVRESIEHPVRYFDVNVGGTISLLNALGETGPVPIALVSSGAVYGPCEGRVTEDRRANPTNPYGASKLAAEEVLRAHARTGASGLVVLRCFNIAGAVGGVGDPDTTRIIPKALAVAAGLADRLVVNGDGKAVREFTHVADAAAAVVAGLLNVALGEERTYNIGSGVESSMVDVLTAAELTTGHSIPVEHGPPKDEPSILVADSSRIRNELGWRPLFPDLRTIVTDAWEAVNA